MFSERKNVCKEPIRGSLRVQFLPAGDTVCGADCAPPKRKTRKCVSFFLCFHYTIDEPWTLSAALSERNGIKIDRTAISHFA